MGLNVQPTLSMLKTALTHVNNYLEVKKSANELTYKIKKNYKNLMMMAYYRNNLVHVFLNESLIATTILAFGESIGDEKKIMCTRLWE
jgi:glycerol-3-phosphate O-acyltransferase